MVKVNEVIIWCNLTRWPRVSGQYKSFAFLWWRLVCISKLVPRIPPVPYDDEWRALVLDWSIQKLKDFFFLPFSSKYNDVAMEYNKKQHYLVICSVFELQLLWKFRKSEEILFRATWWTFKQTWLKFKEFFWNNPKKNWRDLFATPIWVELDIIKIYLFLYIFFLR